jgi:2-dehydropantoate 2-reductase
MKILMVGAGGVGGYYGGRLVEGGADVTFLVRPRRRLQLQEHGLQVRSPLGDLQCPVKTVLADEVKPEFDFILIACKAYDLEDAIASAAPAVDGSATIIPLLNGLAHFERLDARFGQDRVMGGTVMINALLGPDGVIRHTDPLQRLFFGERDRTTSARAHAFASLLKRTKINWELSENVLQNLWEKLTFLSVLAAATCLYRGNVGEILSAPGGRESVEQALDANIVIAAREGHPPRAEVIDFARRRLTDPSGTWSASMLHDVETGGRTEADHIVGWMLDRGRAHGVDVPLLSWAYTHLKTYEARRAAGRLPNNGVMG